MCPGSHGTFEACVMVIYFTVSLLNPFLNASAQCMSQVVFVGIIPVLLYIVHFLLDGFLKAGSYLGWICFFSMVEIAHLHS